MLKYIYLIVLLFVFTESYEDKCDGNYCAKHEVCDAGVCTCPYGMMGRQCQIPCDVTLSGQKSISVSTKNYRNLLRCEWKVPLNMRVELHVAYFDIEISTYIPARCYDVLEMNFRSKSNTFHCGRGENLRSITVLQPGDSVRFFTDFTQLGRGFRFNLKYTILATLPPSVTPMKTTTPTPTPPTTRIPTTTPSGKGKTTLKHWPCTLKEVPGEPDYYYLGGHKMPCPKKTTFSLKLCTCVYK